MILHRRLLLASISLLMVSSAAHAQWVTNGAAMCVAPNLQARVQMVADTQGGAILVWVDSRNSATTGDDIYAQRVNAWGYVQWAVNGIAVCSAPNSQSFVKAIPDGSGGAIVEWSDSRNGGSGIYAQRLDASGGALWASQGIMVNDEVGLQYDAEIVTDGDGGAILVWTDGRDFAVTSWNIYAQRINYNGEKLWTPPGVVVCANAAAQEFPVLVSDGQQGAMVMWADQRNVATQGEDQYIQRISGQSVALWTPGGVPLATSPDDDVVSTMAADGSGGALCTWARNVSGIHVQRVNSSGVAQWGAGGQMLCNTSSYFPVVIDDELGGAIVAWNDYRGGGAGSEADVYGARYTDAGLEWGGSNGLAIADASMRQGAEFMPTIHNAPDEWMIAWMDSRDGLYDIYAQRYDIDSNRFWQDDGVVVTQAAGDQTNPVMVPDGAGGALIAWEDARDAATTDGDIYAIRIGGSGSLTGVRGTPQVASALRLDPNAPNPFSGSTEIRFDLATASAATVEVFDVAGRSVLTRALGSLGPGPHTFRFDGRDGRGASLPSGEYFYRVTAAGTTRAGKFVLTH